MADVKVRTSELNTEALTPASDDFVAVDGSTNGTRKYKLTRLMDLTLIATDPDSDGNIVFVKGSD